MVSIAMSAFQFAGVLCTPIHAVTISKMGRKNAIIVGFVCMLVANTGLGMLALINYDNWRLFYFFSCLIRFIQGYGDTLATTTALSLISTNFQDEKTKYISIMEAAGGLGLMVGPPMGGFLFGIFNYAWTFYLFSVLITVNLLLQIYYVPNCLNNSVEHTFERSLLVSGQYGSSRSYVTINTRNHIIDRHNVRNILASMDDDPSNKMIVESGVGLRRSLRGTDLFVSTTPSLIKTKIKFEHCNLLSLNDVSMLTVLKCKEATLAFLACAVSMYNISFFTPFLSV